MTRAPARAQGSGARSLARIGWFTAACLLVSNMIGTGVFGTTGFMAGDLGSPAWILALWLAGMLYALAGACAYGELGAMLPRAGGEYAYIREAFGPLPGFLSGWASFTIAFSAAIAANAVLFAGHLRELAPGLAGAEGLARGKLLELALVWGLTAVHVAGLAAGGLVQRALTIAKVAAIGLFLVLGFGWGAGDAAHLAHAAEGSDPTWSVALVSFLYVTYSYSGWNASSYVAHELADPARDLPRSMLLGTLAVGGLYLALNALYLWAQPVEALAGEPLVGHATARALFGPGVGRWFTAGLALSIAGATSAMIWAGPRVYSAMAEDGVFPRFFARTSPVSGVPVRSIVLQSVWVSALVLWGSFEALVKYASSILILFGGLGVLAVFVLRRKRPEWPRPYRAAGYPWLPGAYLAVSLAILFAAVREQVRAAQGGEPFGHVTAALATLLAGLPFYFVWSRRSRARGS